MNTGVTVVCFLLSYAIVLGLEISRLVARVPGRMLAMIGMMVVGWIAHTLFLADRLWASISHQDNPLLLSSWFQWSLLAAWGIATIYLFLLVRRPENAIGIFVLPLVLSLIGIAHVVRDSPPFQREASVNFWRIFHGVSLLVGTMLITFGLAVGLMYVVHAYRLKRKLRPTLGFRLPSLEYLQSLNRLCVFVSTAALGLGLVSGGVLNFNRSGQIAWLDRGILFPTALFLWLLVATIIEMTSARSLGGMRTAYLSIANFLFFVFVWGVVLFSSHGRPMGQAVGQVTIDRSHDRRMGAVWAISDAGRALSPLAGSQTSNGIRPTDAKIFFALALHGREIGRSNFMRQTEVVLSTEVNHRCTG